jgi:hypothetical protein
MGEEKTGERSTKDVKKTQASVARTPSAADQAKLKQILAEQGTGEKQAGKNSGSQKSRQQTATKSNPQYEMVNQADAIRKVKAARAAQSAAATELNEAISGTEGQSPKLAPDTQRTRSSEPRKLTRAEQQRLRKQQKRNRKAA